MFKNAPIIGYTTKNFSIDPLQWAIRLAIRLAGGRPLRLKPDNPRYDFDIDGLIIGGGTDLYPEMYDLDPKPDYSYDHERDEMENRWIRRVEEDNIPILGICRGAQLINVMRGGTLHPDVALAYEEAQYPSGFIAQMIYRKTIEIDKNSRLYDLLQRERIKVNSLHKQSVDKLGQGLRVTARETNGVIQGIEADHHCFCLGVQFHPEVLIYRAPFRKIFKALISAARNN